jgi:peptidoglycan hydrolase CwlO-like protein
MKRSHKKQQLGILTLVALLMGLVSSAYSQQLVKVDGVTAGCVHNQMHQVQHPGSGTLFPAPQYGYCNGTIEQKCATANGGTEGYQEIPTACVGTFTSFADLQTQQATSLADLKQQLQEQLNILKASIKTLSDTSDALTKRLNEVDARLKKLEQPQ